MSASLPLETPGVTESPEIELNKLLDLQRTAFMRDGSPDLKTRFERLDRCVQFVTENQLALAEAISEVGS